MGFYDGGICYMIINTLEWKHHDGYKDKIVTIVELDNFEQVLRFTDMLIKFMKDENETQSSTLTTR